MELYFNKSKTKKDFLFSIIITIFYFLINLYLLFHHEPWRDEAQAWLISRDLTYKDIIRQMQYEGHPFLWYIVLSVFSKLGFAYTTIGFISLISMTISVFLIVYYLPINRIARLMIVFSAIFMYYYPVISRSYCLIVLLICVLGTLYPSRHEHPVRYGICIALLFQTHILIFGFAFSLLFLFIIENLLVYKKNKIFAYVSVFIQISSLILIFVQLLSSVNRNSFVIYGNNIGKSNIINIIIDSMSYILFVINDCVVYSSNLLLIIVFSIVLIVLYYLFFVYYPKQGLMILFGVGFQCIVHSLIYSCNMIHKELILCIIILFSIWTSLHEKRNELFKFKVLNNVNIKFIFGTICVFSIVMSFASTSSIRKDIKSEIEMPYSNSKLIAKFIITELPIDSIIIATNDFKASSIAPYLSSQRLWYPINENFFTFVTWDVSRTKQITAQEFLDKVSANFKHYNNVYLLKSSRTSIIDNYLNKQIPLKVINNHSISDEDFYAIYKYK